MNAEPIAEVLPRGAMDRPTRTQLLVLEWEADGLAELELQTGLVGGALHAAINACKRRGWINHDGMRTKSGDAAMRRPPKR